MAKFPPKGSILKSIVDDRLSIQIALGELIDNAIDANARSVTIEVGLKNGGKPQWLRIEDDGDGCAKLSDMVQLGSHTDHKTTLLGRYGIGAKNAMLWLGGEDSIVEIRSVRDGVARRLRLPWRDYAADEWDIKDSWISEEPSDGARGTSIRIKPTIRRFPDGDDLDRLLAELGYMYTPAIKKHGVQIQIRLNARGAEPIVLKRWELPALTDVVDTEIAVGTRRARVYVGIVAEGVVNAKPGLTYVHGFRVIKQSCGLGSGGMDYSGVCGFVDLDRSWDLTKNKDDVSKHQDELGDAVFAAIQPLLMKAASRGHQLQSAIFCDAVNRELAAFIGTGTRDAKAKRGKGEREGAVTPKGTGRKHRRAAKEQSGSTFPSRLRSDGLRVSFNDFGEPDKLGSYSEGQVILNLGNPFIASARAEDNRKVCAFAALVLIIDDAKNENGGGQRKLKFATNGDMSTDIGRALAHDTLDGANLSATDAEKDAAE